ncbi:30S ribosomal protein S18 [Ostreibacterium oceani]|uniref:Small ribosomal subunit protein bS18 n=1 Tax=Ostreibacterium oceani TaxID=2654998 RepID=A0A6N7ESR4_9GAMM|nr:30S ribosomal protein S18 [Ostreibacterium oceani]MPV85591.1 30S ribosomal protein S18 [Ostreibacterium oceani]
MAKMKRNQAENIDYKELDVLKSFLTEAGKIVPSRVTGASAQQQKRIAKAVKQARFLALIPYTDKH